MRDGVQQPRALKWGWGPDKSNSTISPQNFLTLSFNTFATLG